MSETPYTDLMKKLAAADAAGLNPLPMTVEEHELLHAITWPIATKHRDRLWHHFSAESRDMNDALQCGEALMMGAFFKKKVWGKALAGGFKWYPAGGTPQEDAIRGWLHTTLKRELTSHPELRKAERRATIAPMQQMTGTEKLLGTHSTAKSGARAQVPEDTAAALISETKDVLEQEYIAAAPGKWVALVAQETNEPLKPPPPEKPRPTSDEARVALEFLPWVGQSLKAGIAGKNFNKSVWHQYGGVDNDKTGKLLDPAKSGIVAGWLRAFCLKHDIYEADRPEVFTAFRRALLLWKPEIVSTGGLLSPDATL